MTHNANLEFSKITHPYITFINKRITFSDFIINKQKEYYKEIEIPSIFSHRYVKIFNCISIPNDLQRESNDKLRIYYAGRGGYQKRLQLLFEIFGICIEEGLNLEYHLAGTFEGEIPTDLKDKIVWHGSISGEQEIYSLHKKMDILIMTSRFEGFPLVISEAMSCGVAIIAPSIDGIPEHIRDAENGFLLYGNDEKEIVRQSVENTKRLLASKDLLKKISDNNYRYAKSHFSREAFVAAYRNAFGI